jgi:putative Holliday junction resolvase
LSRFLAVDPGEKRIGIAISDPTATIAGPLMVLSHSSRYEDAISIIGIAKDNSVSKIIIGEARDSNDELTEQSRRARNLAKTIQQNSDLEVEMWDESFSTTIAQRTVQEMGVGKKKRRGHHDALAATVILQSFLDYLRTQKSE